MRPPPDESAESESPEDAPPDNEVPDDEPPEDFTDEPLVTVATFHLLKDALPARLQLESDGLDCVLLDETIAGLNPIYTLAGGGMRLQVRAADAARARELLGFAPLPSALPHPCPECGSTDTHRADRHRRWAFFLIFFALIDIRIFPAYRPTWRCAACGHEWKQG